MNADCRRDVYIASDRSDVVCNLSPATLYILIIECLPLIFNGKCILELFWYFSLAAVLTIYALACNNREFGGLKHGMLLEIALLADDLVICYEIVLE